MADAQQGAAQAGENAARAMFGSAGDQAAVDQVAAATNKAELSQAIDHYTASRAELNDWVKSEGDPEQVIAYDKFLEANAKHWLAREVMLKWKRVLKRVDLTSRSIVALVEPGSCFAGTLAELVFAADRSYMLIGQMDGDNKPPAAIILDEANLSGRLPMSNGLSRLATRFLDDGEQLGKVKAAAGRKLDAEAAEELGLVTFAPDAIDWDDEVRIAIEERSSLSPDALTGMEQNLRFGGAETMDNKIFGRLTAWQNWIFQRPNAVGEKGALKVYGKGEKAAFDWNRV